MLILKLSAWIGFLASLSVHLCTLSGFVPFGKATFILHVGMFVVMLPALLVHGRALKAQGTWQTFRGFPILSQLMIVALLVNGIATMLTLQHPKNPAEEDLVSMIRGFSAIWCYLYFFIASLVSRPPR